MFLVEVSMRFSSRDFFTRFVLFVFSFILTITVSSRLCAEDSGSSIVSPNQAELSAPAFVSALFPFVSVSLSIVPIFAPETSSIMPWIGYPVLLGAHVPLYWVDPGLALGYTVAGLSLPAAGVGLMFTKDSFPLALPASDVLLKSYGNLMMYSVYDAYRRTRPSGGGSALEELAIAPFLPENFLSPLVWIPSIAAPTALVVYHLVFDADRLRPVYETGVSRIGSFETNPFAGGVSAAAFGASGMLAVSIGEESYYRGFVYENLKQSLGTLSARALDMVLFPAIHVSSDLQSGLTTETILFNFTWRSLMTLVFDVAYDEEGLQAAVAVHFWSDFILVMAQWVFYSG